MSDASTSRVLAAIERLRASTDAFITARRANTNAIVEASRRKAATRPVAVAEASTEARAAGPHDYTLRGLKAAEFAPDANEAEESVAAESAGAGRQKAPYNYSIRRFQGGN